MRKFKFDASQSELVGKALDNMQAENGIGAGSEVIQGQFARFLRAFGRLFLRSFGRIIILEQVEAME
ncbi:MAG: hypothetical protein AAF990_07710 [Bacteroidota bacterium]